MKSETRISTKGFVMFLQHKTFSIASFNGDVLTHCGIKEFNALLLFYLCINWILIQGVQFKRSSILSSSVNNNIRVLLDKYQICTEL